MNHAFLQGKLHDEVYMVRPALSTKIILMQCASSRRLFTDSNSPPRAWYNELRAFLLYFGFTNSIADASLFIYNKNGVLLYILVYVDDIILTGNNQHHLNLFITLLSNRFSLKDLGTLSYFLGIEAHYSPKGLLLTQR